MAAGNSQTRAPALPRGEQMLRSTAPSEAAWDVPWERPLFRGISRKRTGRFRPDPVVRFAPETVFWMDRRESGKRPVSPSRTVGTRKTGHLPAMRGEALWASGDDVPGLRCKRDYNRWAMDSRRTGGDPGRCS